MALISLENLMQSSGPLLGIDPGTKTFGLAVSDTTRLIASPVETIRRKKFTPDAAKIFALYDERGCAAMVIGYPVNMDGSEGPRAQSVKDLCLNLINIRDVPILLWDERMSTAAVTRTLLEADTSRAKRAEVVDKLAATYILQGVLDRLRV
ncbi:MAG: Holliday junction resolvase RuvX [Robiginitomaculum sp.]|nr:MAG: Holliday junction resolvase RuvX [Robiginitomaculum sp.]